MHEYHDPGTRSYGSSRRVDVVAQVEMCRTISSAADMARTTIQMLFRTRV